MPHHRKDLHHHPHADCPQKQNIATLTTAQSVLNTSVRASARAFVESVAAMGRQAPHRKLEESNGVKAWDEPAHMSLALKHWATVLIFNFPTCNMKFTYCQSVIEPSSHCLGIL
eukprot:3075992-Amphidinium_carterae.1